MRCSPRTSLVLVALLAWCGSAAAQTAQRSTIEGVVMDADGATIAGATLTLSGSRVLGGSRKTATDEAGRYRFAELLPGSYDVEAAAPGFSAAKRPGIQLPVETTYTIDMRLLVAGVVERVDVPAHAALIDVRASATPTVIGEAALHDLPTERTLQSLLSLAPGVTTAPPLYGIGGEVAFGGTQGSNGLTVDGVTLNESLRGFQWSQVHYNWLEEAQVVGAGAPAEYQAGRREPP